MEEQWKEIEGFSRYKVSPDGEVLDTKTNKLVAKQLTGKPQYYYVNVNRDDGKRKLKRVHRFVAEAYVEGRSEEFNIVDHIDRDKFNNHYTNLRWVDHSGNQRNKEGNIYIFSEAVKDYSQRYENPEVAYTYLAKCLLEGMSDQEVVDKYQEHLDYGLKRIVVEWEGVETYLVDLCTTYRKDYKVVANRLGQDIPIWNAIYDIPKNFNTSLEIPCGLVTGHWFPSKKYLGEYFGNSGDSLRDMADKGCTYQELKAYDKLDHFRQTVLGVTGTVTELCKHFGKSLCSVETRVNRGYTLEKALTEKAMRVKKVTINGVSKDPKGWYEFFGLDYKKVKSYKDRTKCTFEDALVRFGVEIDNMEIIYST